MYYNCCQMISKRVHSPYGIINAVGKPAQWLIMIHVECGEHPFQVLPGKPTVIFIKNEIYAVIPVQKLPIQGKGKQYKGYCKDKNACQP